MFTFLLAWTSCLTNIWDAMVVMWPQCNVGLVDPDCTHYYGSMYPAGRTRLLTIDTDPDVVLLHHQGLPLLTLPWDKNWDSHSLVNGYPSFYIRIALVAPSPVLQKQQQKYSCVNPLCDHFFSGIKNIYLSFMWFLYINITQAVEILPSVKART